MILNKFIEKFMFFFLHEATTYWFLFVRTLYYIIYHYNIII